MLEKIYEVIADKTLSFGCIPWYEDLYVVSNKWDVFSIWWWRWWTIKPKRIKPHYDRQWYLHLALCKDGKRKEYFVHRLVAITHIRLPNDWEEINHKDWVKDNNDVNNLERCTSSENSIHSYKNWLQVQKKGNRKLNKIYEVIWATNWAVMIWDVLDWIEKTKKEKWITDWDICKWFASETKLLKLRINKRKPIDD